MRQVASVFVLFSSLLSVTVAGSGKLCEPPTIAHGLVEAEASEDGRQFNGVFRCEPGYVLSGASQVKCRDGFWSGKIPICIVTTCDPAQLPNLANGKHVQVKGLRKGMYRFSCNRGYRLVGQHRVYCTRRGWNLNTPPVCARPGCDESQMLGVGLPFGRFMSMFQGSFYRFSCDSGYSMAGEASVYCDGNKWNGTKPDCVGPPAPPVLTVGSDEEGGPEEFASSDLIEVGQTIRLTCSSQGGNPWPRLSFVINGTRQEAERLEPLVFGHEAVLSLEVTRDHANMDLACVAENELSQIPVSSNHRTLGVKFGPSHVYIQGPEEIEHHDGERAEFSCFSDESNPPSDIAVIVRDQSGNEVVTELAPLPIMKTSIGFSTRMNFRFQVPSDVEAVSVACTAANAAATVTEERTINIKKLSPPEVPEVRLTGPDTFLTGSQPPMFNCVAEGTEKHSAELTWSVRAEDGAEVEHKEHSVTLDTGDLASVMEFDTNIDTDSVTIACNVENEARVGMAELLVNKIESPQHVSIQTPAVIFFGMSLEFSCSTASVRPKPRIIWTVTDFEDRELELPSDIREEEGEVVSSHISLTPAYSSRSLTVHCRAENSVGYTEDKQTLDLTYVSVQISGAEEGDNITKGGEMTFTCSVETVPGLTSVSWYRGEELLEVRDLVTEDQRLVDRLTLDTANLETGESVILCRPDLVTAGFNNNDMAASVRINLIEEEKERNVEEETKEGLGEHLEQHMDGNLEEDTEESLEYDSNEVEYYDEEQDGEYYDDYASSEEDSYESDQTGVTEIITSNPGKNSEELSDATEEVTNTDTTTSTSFLEHDVEDQQDAVGGGTSQQDNSVNDQRDESQYEEYNYDGASATDYYEGASYHQDYSFGNNNLDREEIVLTEEHSEDFKVQDEAGDATEIKDEEEEDAATNAFTSREKVLAQTKQRAENGNNVATFSEKQLRSGSSKLGSYFLSQALVLLLMFKLL